MERIYCYVLHKAGIVNDCAVELISAAQKINPAATPVAVALGWGSDFNKVCDTLRSSFGEVIKISHESLSYPNAELIRQALVKVLPKESIFVAPHEHLGIDLCPGLSIKLNTTYVSDVLGIEGIEGSRLRVLRQEFGGQVSTHVSCNISNGAVITVRPGSFKPVEAHPVNGAIVDRSSDIVTLTSRRRYLETVIAESGDVDITKQSILVSVGRGIQEKENLAIAQELADALGAAVSCSRPVVDAKWLEKSRQVGTSGKTVKPRVYLACGISGAFQHLAGIQGNPLIVAINKNPKAPIFQVADVGIVDDLLEFLPEMTLKVREMHTLSTK